ncbi:MAG: hypothetical protein ACO2PN_14240 [Pyrobaculum sp.]
MVEKRGGNYRVEEKMEPILAVSIQTKIFADKVLPLFHLHHVNSTIFPPR